ncbi:MAG: CoA transferase, partial [Pseudomonadota bacterium]
PYNVYKAQDGHVAILCIRDGHWRNLVEAMKQPELLEDPRFETMQTRSEHMRLVDGTVEAWTSQLPKQKIFEIAQEHGVICSPVKDIKEVMEDEHLYMRGMLQMIEHPVLGEIPLPSTPLRFVGEDAPVPRPSRELGQDNESIYYELLGLNEAEVAELKAEEAI